MTREQPLAFEGAAELRRMLRELGQAPTNPPRGAEAEVAREARMATGIELELERLVGARRRLRRWGVVALSAAATLLLAFGARRFWPNGGALAISQEPLAVKAWKAPASAAIAPELPLPAESAARRPVPPPRSSTLSAPSAPSAAVPVTPPQSTLAEENQWFKEAAEASRGGDVDRALTRLEQLLREHPQSPLAQTALVRKFRLLAKAGRTEDARQEARRYLAAYPTGFAVGEAQGIERGEQAQPSQEHAEP